MAFPVTCMLGFIMGSRDKQMITLFQCTRASHLKSISPTASRPYEGSVYRFSPVENHLWTPEKCACGHASTRPWLTSGLNCKAWRLSALALVTCSLWLGICVTCAPHLRHSRCRCRRMSWQNPVWEYWFKNIFRRSNTQRLRKHTKTVPGLKCTVF